jgi:hypothetical protein
MAIISWSDAGVTPLLAVADPRMGDGGGGGVVASVIRHGVGQPTPRRRVNGALSAQPVSRVWA